MPRIVKGKNKPKPKTEPRTKRANYKPSEAKVDPDAFPTYPELMEVEDLPETIPQSLPETIPQSLPETIPQSLAETIPQGKNLIESEVLEETMPQDSLLPETVPQDELGIEELPETIPQTNTENLNTSFEKMDIHKVPPLPTSVTQDDEKVDGDVESYSEEEKIKKLITKYPLALDNISLKNLEKASNFIMERGDVATLTVKQMRKQIEELYGLPSKFLRQYKEEVKMFAKKYAESLAKKQLEAGDLMEIENENEEMGREILRKKKKKKKRKPEIDIAQRRPKRVAREPKPPRRRAREPKKKKKLTEIWGEETNGYEFFVDADDRKCNVMLNQTNITTGMRGNNKFYVIQLLNKVGRDDDFCLITRWGRVGVKVPQNGRKLYNNKYQAYAEFKKKFKSKTDNIWGTDVFRPKHKKYIMLDIMDEEELGKEIGWEDEEDDLTTASQLDKAVFDLMRKICSKRVAAAALKSMDMNIDQFPLGMLTKKMLQSGYQILSLLSQALEKKEPPERLHEITNRFYTLIPHDFGYHAPPPIVSRKALLKKVELLQLLSDLQAGSSILKIANSAHTNIVDLHYHALNCDIEVVEPELPQHDTIRKMISGTHGPTHDKYTLEVQEIFTIDRKGESFRNLPFTRLHNHRMLWHGSRISNFTGILSQGLRIAPPEAPRTGYMFGKGLYFADCVSKSANYAKATEENPYGLLVLCDVALGEMNVKKEAEFLRDSGKYYHSVWAQGKLTPDTDKEEDLEIVNPAMNLTGKAYLGPLVKSGIEDTRLDYNEYIVYDVSQVRMRYLVLTKFNFKN